MRRNTQSLSGWMHETSTKEMPNAAQLRYKAVVGKPCRKRVSFSIICSAVLIYIYAKEASKGNIYV